MTKRAERCLCVCVVFLPSPDADFRSCFLPPVSAPAVHFRFVRTTSCFGDRKYQRSWEGSACVFISSVVFVSCFWYTFLSPLQFWTAMIVLPPAMAYAEASAPHTVDTPMLMGVGGTLLWIISHVKFEWQ